MAVSSPVPTVVTSSSSHLKSNQKTQIRQVNQTPNTTTTTTTTSTKDPILYLLQKCHTITQFPSIHAAVVKSGRSHDQILLFKLIRKCFDLGSMDYASKIFENIVERDVYHYTALMAGSIAAGSYLDAVCVYARMLAESIRPDSFVISHCLRACAMSLALDVGRQIHGQATKLGFGSDRPVRMRLMEFYGKFGEFDEAWKVFGELPDSDGVAATIFISCYADRGLIENSWAVFVRVPKTEKDTVCWTAMIDGYVRNGRMNEALELFREMQKEGMSPNEVTIVCVLSACSQLGALELGRWVHSYVGKYNIRLNFHVGSALIDMYSRCGSLDEALKVFNDMSNRDVVTYNSMIAGFALHGKSHEAVELFRQMAARGLCPSPISFVGVLNACSHGGMVDIAFEFFNGMTKNYGIEPRIEHYGCIVDLLGRVRHLQKAYDFIKKMRVKPDHIIWGSLLSACKIHGNLKLGEEVANILISNKSADSGTYILLANMYALFGQWEAAAGMREKMRKVGIQKEPGCSSIEVDDMIHEFLLGDVRHPQRYEIYRKLEEMTEILKLEGYTPAKEVVLQDIEEGEKEWSLSIHSERLAICYGLISTKPGSTIRVVKNLRVCNDCHNIIKLIAKITRRKIVVRDRKRFHHFEDGICSCGDYW